MSETGRVDLKFTKDTRILAGVSGAVNHMAETAGMDESRRAELVATLEDALRAAFSGQFHEDSPVEMSLVAPTGRMEVVLAFHADTGGGKRAKEIQRVVGDRVDSVTLDVRDGTSRLTIVRANSVRGKKR